MEMKTARITQAGMYRSGTTWQFNALRVILEMKYGIENVDARWCEHRSAGKPIELIKAHRIKKALARTSDFIFTTERSEEGIKGSMQRRRELVKDARFNNASNMARYDEFMVWANWWKSKSHYVQQFDLIEEAPDKLINDYMSVLGISDLDAKDVLKEMTKQMIVPAEGYDPRTLIHAGHITRRIKTD